MHMDTTVQRNFPNCKSIQAYSWIQFPHTSHVTGGFSVVAFPNIDTSQAVKNTTKGYYNTFVLCAFVFRIMDRQKPFLPSGMLLVFCLWESVRYFANTMAPLVKMRLIAKIALLENSSLLITFTLPSFIRSKI